FGAGHVAQALVLALAPLPFSVRWIDGRDGVFPAAVPGSVVCVASRDPAAEIAQAPADAMVLVMTHSHALDLDIVMAALASQRLGYVGLIGSASKRARFVAQLAKAGLDAATLARLICPVGLPGLPGKEPAVIAASIAADLLMRRAGEKGAP
ncbi:MAG: xanthine dehydrogenase accessory protein XdhC, partial [Beijerinckiaceae bacterium]